MKRLIIAIFTLLLIGNVVWADKAGNQFNTNPIKINGAATIGTSTVQFDSPRFISNIVWHLYEADQFPDSVPPSFCLEDGRGNKILHDSNYRIHRSSVLYNLNIPIQGIHCTSITSKSELFIFHGRE